MREVVPPVAIPATKADLAGSFAAAAVKAQPAVVNIYTSKQVKIPAHPLLNDPFFRRFLEIGCPTRPSVPPALGSG